MKASRKKDHPDYTLYCTMIRRVENPNKKEMGYYNHVTIDSKWRDDFWNFVNDMGDRPSRLHTLDRIDNSKGYCKPNCRWATRSEQVLNRRIVYECLKGHPWKPETTMLTHNGFNKTRRCKICFENRMSK